GQSGYDDRDRSRAHGSPPPDVRVADERVIEARMGCREVDPGADVLERERAVSDPGVADDVETVFDRAGEQDPAAPVGRYVEHAVREADVVEAAVDLLDEHEHLLARVKDGLAHRGRGLAGELAAARVEDQRVAGLDLSLESRRNTERHRRL